MSKCKCCGRDFPNAPIEDIRFNWDLSTGGLKIYPNEYVEGVKVGQKYYCYDSKNKPIEWSVVLMDMDIILAHPNGYNVDYITISTYKNNYNANKRCDVTLPDFDEQSSYYQSLTEEEMKMCISIIEIHKLKGE